MLDAARQSLVGAGATAGLETGDRVALVVRWAVSSRVLRYSGRRTDSGAARAAGAGGDLLPSAVNPATCGRSRRRGRHRPTSHRCSISGAVAVAAAHTIDMLGAGPALSAPVPVRPSNSTAAVHLGSTAEPKGVICRTPTSSPTSPPSPGLTASA
jgi:hypothetical protein